MESQETKLEGKNSPFTLLTSFRSYPFFLFLSFFFFSLVFCYPFLFIFIIFLLSPSVRFFFPPCLIKKGEKNKERKKYPLHYFACFNDNSFALCQLCRITQFKKKGVSFSTPLLRLDIHILDGETG